MNDMEKFERDEMVHILLAAGGVVGFVVVLFWVVVTA
jgi:hypothetical protein